MITQRNIALCIILSIITCGIYGLYWLVCLSDDTNTVAGEEGTSGVMVLVLTLVTCGIYGWYWAYMQGQKIDAAKNAKGFPSSNSGILYLILFFVSGGIIAYAIMQNELNKLAEA